MHEQDETHSNGEAGEDLLDLNEVMRAFGIDAWRNLGPVGSSQPGTLALLVEVQGQRHVLKERTEGFVGEDLSHRYDFQRYLQQAGLPVPALWRTPQGTDAVTLGDESFELQQWAGGEPFSTTDPRNLTWISAAGALLGRLHQASQRYQGHPHRWPSEVHMGAQVQGWLEFVRQRAEVSEPQALASALTDWAERWETVLPRAMMAIGAGHVPELHIHGDYHALNLRFDEFGVTALLGLEASHWEKRIFEVAYGLFSFSALAWQPGESLPHPQVKRGLDPERARLFLHAYAGYCPPARGEASLLADALTLIAPIACINGPLEDLFYTSVGAEGTPSTTLIEDLLERLAWSAALPAWLARTRNALAEMWS